MNILNNRNKRISIFKAVALCLIAAMSFTLVSCDDDMDIQATLKAGTQKNTTHTSVGVTNFCQTRSIRHEP